MTRILAARLVLVSLASSGCYYTFGTAPPSGPRRAGESAPDCTRSRALPIADTVMAVEGAGSFGFGLWALLAIKDDGSLPAGEALSGASLFLVTGAVLLIANGLSARAGYRDSARCREYSR